MISMLLLKFSHLRFLPWLSLHGISTRSDKTLYLYSKSTLVDNDLLDHFHDPPAIADRFRRLLVN